MAHNIEFFKDLFFEDYYPGTVWVEAGGTKVIYWTDKNPTLSASGTQKVVSSLSGSELDIAKSAFNEWDEVLDSLEFKYTTDPSKAQISIGWSTHISTWGWWYSSWINNIRQVGEIQLNQNLRYTSLWSSTNLKHTLLHEIGNIIGLGDISLDSGIDSVLVDPFIITGYLSQKDKEYAKLLYHEDASNTSDERNTITGTPGNDLITGGVGGDTIDGAEGIDTAVYTVNFGDVSLAKSGAVWNITSGTDEDALSNIERLKFNDKHIALDLDGHAGETVKLLGLLLGKAEATNTTYVGAGLKLLDDGMTYEQLMSAALDVVLGANASSLSVVELIWNNLIGPPTPADNIGQYATLIDNGTYTSAGLAIVAADHSLNTTAIDLVGLAQTGVEYLPYG